MTDRLIAFTPDPGGLDRDAILFAAGRQSARGSQWWRALAGVLAVTQAVTLFVLWPTPQSLVESVCTPPVVAPVPAPDPPPPPSADVWTAGSPLDVVHADRTHDTGEYVSAGPPLTAWSARRPD
jgi:hypothetical protein